MNKLRKAKFSILCDVTSVVRLEENLKLITLRRVLPIYSHMILCVAHLFSYDSVLFPIYSQMILCASHLFSYDSVCSPSIIILFCVSPCHLFSYDSVCSPSILMWFQCAPHLLPWFCVFTTYSDMILCVPHVFWYDSVCSPFILMWLCVFCCLRSPSYVRWRRRRLPCDERARPVWVEHRSIQPEMRRFRCFDPGLGPFWGRGRNCHVHEQTGGQTVLYSRSWLLSWWPPHARRRNGPEAGVLCVGKW